MEEIEDLKEMISNVHEALEGRYELTGYDLHMIHGLLCEFDVLSNSNNNPLVIANVSGRSEQLTAFCEWIKDNHSIEIHDMILQDYIKYGG